MPPKSADRITLPARPFLYTLSQVAHLLGVSEPYLKSKLCYFRGRSSGIRSSDVFDVRNIAKLGDPPVWRVTENELVRWMKRHGYQVYERRMGKL